MEVAKTILLTSQGTEWEAERGQILRAPLWGMPGMGIPLGSPKATPQQPLPHFTCDLLGAPKTSLVPSIKFQISLTIRLSCTLKRARHPTPELSQTSLLRQTPQ